VNALRILIVAGDPLARAALAALLAGQPGLQVAGQVSGEDLTPDTLEAFSPDAVLWDLGWSSTDSLDRLAELPSNGPPVVALLSPSVHPAEAWAAGVGGLLSRETSGPGLQAALLATAQGLTVFAPEAIAALAPSSEQLSAQPVGELTPREMQVLHLLAEGLPNKSIAARLGISEHTVKFHVNSVMGKLGAQSRTDAVMRATRSGLIIL
jgi:two-component system, NarL family, nitrate/nitrite response regulator NarL